MTQLLYQVFKAEQVEPLDRVEESETAFEKIKDNPQDPLQPPRPHLRTSQLQNCLSSLYRKEGITGSLSPVTLTDLLDKGLELTSEIVC